MREGNSIGKAIEGMLPPPAPTWPDPFPMLKWAQNRLWRALDWWAYRRMQKLGVPSPWMAYEMGRRDERRDAMLAKVRH